MTNPSRARSNGRDARAGSLLKPVDKTRSEQKPANTNGVMHASAPAVMTTSACPVRMQVSAWPMAWALDEHAVEMVKFGPLAPWATATMPDAEFSVITGMKLGWTRCGF